MSRESRLHIPRPPARPGAKPDFSYLATSPAGAVKRPDVNANTRDIEFLSTEMVRVLDDQHTAVGPWNPHLDAPDLQIGLRHMLLTRIFDDRMLRIQRQGKISFYIKSTGEEAVSVAQCMALRPADMLFPSYRTQGLQIARGRSLVDLMCQCLSNTRDMCKGRQMPVMYHWGSGNIFSVGGNLTTQFPQAVGWAMAAAIKGEDHIAAAWIGEGSSAEPDFHHALTFAAVYRAPVILNVVNNQWAISTFQGFAGGEAQVVRGAGSRLRHSRHSRRRQRLSRRARGHRLGGPARSSGRGTDVDRTRDVSRVGAFDQRRSVALSSEGRRGAVAARRSDRSSEEPPDRDRRMVGRAAAGHGIGTDRHGQCLVAGGDHVRHDDRAADARSRPDVRRRVQGHAATPEEAARCR